MKGTKCCSRRTECTRTDHRACGARQGTGGTRGPEVMSVCLLWEVGKAIDLRPQERSHAARRA